jgi:hypothetical protein
MTHASFARIAVTPLAALVLCGALAAGAGASKTAPSIPAGVATFIDPAGDAQGGPDVTRVVVDGDVATGRIAITITAPGFEPATQDDRERDVLVFLDTDRSAATGDPAGAEYGLQAWNDASGRWWDMSRWNGAGWESVPETPTMRVTSQGSSLTFQVGTTDLGGATSFRFYVFAGTWNTATKSFDTRDEAPDFGYWTYDITSSTPTTPTPTPTPTRVGLLIRPPQTTPKTPVAGKPFAAHFLVQLHKLKTITVIDIETGETRQDLVGTWTPVPRGKATCAATIAGKVLARCGPLEDGDVRVSLVVPKTATGKVLRIAIKVTVKDSETGKTLTARRVASFRVR